LIFLTENLSNQKVLKVKRQT